MEFVRHFKKLDKSNADLAGGKGASLGEMTKAGIPVPQGFVVLSDSFEHFIRETGLYQEIDAILDNVDHKEIHAVDAASEAIRSLVLNAKMPKDIGDVIMRSFKELDAKYVAVRSSATAEDGKDHAWAGQLESYLNTKEEQVLEKVKLCWSSLFTPRAIFYRFEKGLHDVKISVAVVVQKMVESEVSGIAFSVHPVTEDWNQLIIEAGFGLGEAIVSGSVTPDSYVVEKEPRRILDITVSTQEKALYRSKRPSAEHGNNEWRAIPEPKASSQVLTEAQIFELSEIILGIEKHYGFPCDIEWAFEKDKFYIVQSRPITTLAPRAEHQRKRPAPERPADGAQRFVSPELKDVRPEDYDYYGFWKQDLFPGVFWSDCYVPEVLKRMGITSDGVWAITMLAGQYLVKKSERKNLKSQIAKKIAEKDKAFFDNLYVVTDELCKADVKEGERLRTAPPTLENFRAFLAAAKRINFIWLLGASHFNEAAEEALQEAVVAESFPAEKVPDIIPPLVTPLYYRHKELVELKKEVGTKTLAEIKKDKKLYARMQEQAEKYPWIEIFNFIGEPLTVERLYEQVEHMEPDAPKKDVKVKISPEMKWRLSCMSACGYPKQAGAEYFSIYSEKVLPFLFNVGKKIGLTHREFLTLNADEVEQALQGKLSTAELKATAKRRIGSYEYAFVCLKDGKTFFTEEPGDIAVFKTMIPKADKDANQLVGQVGNPGIYTGPVRVVMNTDDFHKMRPGDVLVSTMTTPDFVILMQKAGAIVTDIGGMLCHAAIVSREINRPCVIGTRFATQVLKDGDMVEVNADKGLVRVVGRAPGKS